MWVDRDVRSPRRKKKDETIAAEAERDQERIRAALRAVGATRRAHGKAVERAAENLARALLQSLVEARRKAGFSQSEVADRMNIPQSLVARFEAGTHSPTLTTITRYASAIGVLLEIRRPA
jgi:ribosome-binding protein aMBF1 (putative translation factor)